MKTYSPYTGLLAFAGEHTFYAQGVKANVVFFDNAPKDGRVHTKGVWFYDLRTNQHLTLKTRPLKQDDLRDSTACCHPENRHIHLVNRPPPDVLQQEIIDRLAAALPRSASH